MPPVAAQKIPAAIDATAVRTLLKPLRNQPLRWLPSIGRLPSNSMADHE